MNTTFKGILHCTPYASRLTKIMLIASSILSLAPSAYAHLPMETEYAETLPKDGWEARLHGGYMDMSKGSDKMTEQMYNLKIGYGLTRDLSAYLEPTYKVREMTMVHGGVYLMNQKSSGVGDTDFLVRYRFRKKDTEDESCQQALLLGVKLPTGAWNLEDKGQRLADMAQPGTGSVDYRAGLALTHRKGRFTLDGDLIYRLNTENTVRMQQASCRFGNVLSYDIAGLYQIRDLYLMLELNGRLTDKDEVGGVKDDNTGGHQVFANPGVSYHILENLMLMFSVQLPVYQSMNGNALNTNYHAMGGLHWYY